MINRYKTTPIQGDENASFACSLDQEYTVHSLIPRLIRSGEYGDIFIKDPHTGWSTLRVKAGRYEGGAFISALTPEIAARKVSEVTGTGGWSKMDYVIHLVDENADIKERIISRLLKFSETDYKKLYLFMLNDARCAPFSSSAQYIDSARTLKNKKFPAWIYNRLCENEVTSWRVSPDTLLEVLTK